ncbi:hypothetical protein Patl1_15990 [Pistacia atlantica]|uniref:Uncharacterized protein n=1 Tax=Pistacia atlantica TaxID=434234 RepID=A0ACC1B7T2_9ROSI|nr:hypothetical protein Patl1_15990 [Pistacia atlantica]
MEATATTGMPIVNFLATSPTLNNNCPNNLITTMAFKKTKHARSFALNPISRENVLSFLSRCSTKPDTNTNNETYQNQNFQHNSYSYTNNNMSPPISNETQILPSSLSSSVPPSSRGLVLNLGPKNSWDSAEIGSPVVKRFLSDEEERWFMWYHGNSCENPDSDFIGLAISSNGIHWERGKGPVKSSDEVGLVMNCSKDWWAFDTLSIRPSEVVIMSSNKVRASKNPERFHIHNLSGENGKIFKSFPGLAVSQDGRHWARIEGEHHSGALFDVGSEKDWDSLFIASPQVFFHGNGDLRMYYHSFDMENGEFGISIARSREWNEMGEVGEGKGKRKKREYRIGSVNEWIEGLEEGLKMRQCLRLKLKMDGIMKGVGSPCLVQMDGDSDEWRLYYRGHGNGGRTGNWFGNL